jgi:drug/metabolite transporter (DMT)-like permease
VRVTALLLAIAAAGSWGVGGLLLKRGTDVVTPTTILVFQYVLGFVLVLGWLAATGGVGATVDAVERRWGTILVLVLFQIAGYVFFVSSVQHAGSGSAPTAVVIAISASYPAVVVLLSGPVLGETLQWNHVAGALLVVTGVVLALAL